MDSAPANPPKADAPSCAIAAAWAANASPRSDSRMTAESPKRLRLNHDSRLAQSRDFARVRQQGERLAQGCLIANWNKLPSGARPKLGVVTSKKIGGAIER